MGKTLLTLDYPRSEIFMWAETEDELNKRVVACAKEPETVEWIERIPKGSIFCDVGTNTGAYSFVAAACGHEVMAFEPGAATFARLTENMAENPHLNVAAYPVALSHRTELVGFSYSSREPGAALHEVIHGAMGFVDTIIAYRLDDFLFTFKLPDPEYLKLDTDGHEIAVLEGAKQTLRSVKEILVEEDATLASPGSLLEHHGFRELSRHQHGDTPIANVVYGR